MKELHTEDLQKIELDILKFFINYCQKEGLRYCAAYGTILGAVRHKGFIPWDDDIDVMMPRADYDKFISIFYDENEKYSLLCKEKNKFYIAPFAKLYDTNTHLIQHYGQVEKYEQGVYIDIFPIDGFPNNYEEAVDLYSKVTKLRKKLGYAIHQFFAFKGNIVTRVFKSLYILPYKIIGYHYYLNRLDKVSRTYDYDQCENIGCICFGEGIQEIMKKSDYEPFVTYDFMDIKINVPNNYEYYLQSIYSDWRELPDKKDRVTKHKMEAYRK